MVPQKISYPWMDLDGLIFRFPFFLDWLGKNCLSIEDFVHGTGKIFVKNRILRRGERAALLLRSSRSVS